MLKPVVVTVAILAASALVVPTVSQAATTNSYRVSYADLNLASKNGQHSLQRRIAFGAKVVCEIEDSRALAPLARRIPIMYAHNPARARPGGPTALEFRMPAPTSSQIFRLLSLAARCG